MASIKQTHDENVRPTGKAGGVTTRGMQQRRRAFGTAVGTNGATHSLSSHAGSSATSSGFIASGAASSSHLVSAAGAASASRVDIDALTAHDPIQFTDYAADIHQHYKRVEVDRIALPTYMSHQSDINEKMRAILIDWLVEVHLKFKLMPETMFLTVNLIDRFLERKLVVRQKLQLVGVTAMLLASKYEEIYAPEVRDFVYITDRAYNREQILAMESAMLSTLQFNLTCPTQLHFINRYIKASRVSDDHGKLKYLVRYFVERTLQEFSMLKYLPSMVAASAVNMAMRSLAVGAWDATMTHSTGYSEEELTNCVRDMEGILQYASTSNLQAVRKKYAVARYREVSSVPLVCMQ